MVPNEDILPRIDRDRVAEFQGELEAPEGELYLRFFVGSGMELALPATGIKEVLEYTPDRINLIPNVSPLLLGTVNIRGRVVWVGDLGQFLGNSTAVNTDRSEISIIAIEDQGLMLGLAIDSIGVMTWLDRLRASRSNLDSMAPFVKGEWLLESENVPLKLLDQTSILRSARWAT
jgi:purine-binding chemotaxis protein CheW